MLSNRICLFDMSGEFELFDELVPKLLSHWKQLVGDMFQLVQTLKTIDWLPQIPLFKQIDQLPLLDPNTLAFANGLQLLHLGLKGNRLESEFDATRGQRLDDSYLLRNYLVM